uniref:Uncharacterized protein n=1 Tax=Anguilla anguilla TaxID=7936 RepID=A0A0E9Q614_ANGAN
MRLILINKNTQNLRTFLTFNKCQFLSFPLI